MKYLSSFAKSDDAKQLVIGCTGALFMLLLLPHQSIIPGPVNLRYDDNDLVRLQDRTLFDFLGLRTTWFRLWWPYYLNNLLFSAANSLKDEIGENGIRLLPTDEQFKWTYDDPNMIEKSPLNTWLAFDGVFGGKNTLVNNAYNRRTPENISMKSTKKKKKTKEGASMVVRDPQPEDLQAKQYCCIMTMLNCGHCTKMQKQIEQFLDDLESGKVPATMPVVWIYLGKDQNIEPQDVNKHIENLPGGVPAMFKVENGEALEQPALKGRDVESLHELYQEASKPTKEPRKAVSKSLDETGAQKVSGARMHVKPQVPRAVTFADSGQNGVNMEYGPEPKPVVDEPIQPMGMGERNLAMLV